MFVDVELRNAYVWKKLAPALGDMADAPDVGGGPTTEAEEALIREYVDSCFKELYNQLVDLVRAAISTRGNLRFFTTIYDCLDRKMFAQKFRS